MTINKNKDYLSEVGQGQLKNLGLEVGIITNQWSIVINLFMQISLNSFSVFSVSGKLRWWFNSLSYWNFSISWAEFKTAGKKAVSYVWVKT